MPKAGGGGGASFFTTKIIGPPPGPLTVGLDLWIDLGIIPVGKRIWYGSLQGGSPYKTTTFEVRSNLATKSTGTLADTTLHGSIAASTRSGTVNLDMYKSGTLHVVSTYSTGVERFWLHLISKTSTATDYLYTLNYTTE